LLLVRQASVADVDIIFDLIAAIADHHQQSKYVLTNKDQLRSAGFGQTPSFGVLLAEVDGEIAGYCSYTWDYSIWAGCQYMNIDDVFVWQRFRNNKVGQALMNKAKDVCLANGAKRIRWEVEQNNHRAIRFYQNLGAEFDLKGIFRWNVSEESKQGVSGEE